MGSARGVAVVILCSVVVLLAAFASGWAAPTIQEYRVRHVTLQISDGSEPYTYWNCAIGGRVSPGDAGDSVAGVTITDGSGTAHSITNEGDWGQPDPGLDDVCFCTSWDESELPVGGPYTLVAYGNDGSESPAVATSALSHFASPTPVGSYPVPGSVIMETTPTFVWEEFPGFTGGYPPVEFQGVGANGADWNCLGNTCDLGLQLDPAASSLDHSALGLPELLPGQLYWARVWEFSPWLDDLGSVPGYYLEQTGNIWAFVVYSPDPLINRVDICRGRWVGVGGSEVCDERVRTRATDLDGVTNPDGSPHLSVAAVDPEGRDLPYPDGCSNAWEEGLYTLSQGYGGGGLDQLTVGPFTVIAQDSLGRSDILVTDDVLEPPPVQESVYPVDGEVIPETVPTFVWQPAAGAPEAEQFCVCVTAAADGAVLWVQPGLPPDATSVTYGGDEPLTPGGRYQLHIRAWYPDEDPSDLVTATALTQRDIEFRVYSPVPEIESLWVQRGRDTQPDGTVSYHQRMIARVSDMDGDITSVVITDSHGYSHEAYFQADLGDWRWEIYGETNPSPAGAYTLTVTDAQGYVVTLSAQTSEILEGITPVIIGPPANYSVASSIPVFSWSGPEDMCYCMGVVDETLLPCGKIWCGGRHIPGTEASVLYNDDGGAIQPELTAGRLYLWWAGCGMPDPVEQTDERCSSELGGAAYGEFWVEPKVVGPLQPINSDGSSIFKLNSTVPVKFQLLNADGSYMSDAAATLSVAKVDEEVAGTYQEAVSTAAADSGNTFRYDPAMDQYVLNLSTRGMSVGTWSLQVTVNGVVAREVLISLD